MEMSYVSFRLGTLDIALEVPPFFVNFDKRDYSSMMTRRIKEGRKSLFYIYISRHNQLSKLLLLKAIHPDIFIPVTLKINEAINREEIDTFIESVHKLEKEWTYSGSGSWSRDFFDCRVFMVLIIGEDRWTVRSMVSKKGVEGFGAEIPVDVEMSGEFIQELKDGEKGDLEIHDHTQNRHFHFTVDRAERFIQLAKKWDYYFAHKEVWEQTVKINHIE
jgi:hypothetical protein